MKKSHSLTISVVISLLAVSYMIYYLLQGNVLPFSITSVHEMICQRLENWHVIIVGLLPIYVALMVFGTGVLSIYVAKLLQRWVFNFLRAK